MSTTVGIVVFDDAEELDWVGPWEVFKGQMYGVDHARLVQRAMEYDSAPPYSAEV